VSVDELDLGAARLAADANRVESAAADIDRPRERGLHIRRVEGEHDPELAGVISVLRTVSGGEVVELGKTSGSRRQVPLSPRAVAALDALPARLDTPRLFPAPAGGLLNLDNFRRRVWAPAIEAAAIPGPARIYDLRSTFASNALAAGIDVFELAKVMGTSVRMIERHFGALLTGAAAGIASRLAAFEAGKEERDDRSENV
jgi:integrase